MSGRIDPRQLAAMLRADAQKMGISVEELIKRIMGGGQNVVGHLGAGTIPQGPTFIDAEGGGVWNNVEPEQHEPMDDFEELAQKHSQLLEEAGGDDLGRDVLLRDHVTAEAAKDAQFGYEAPKSSMGQLIGNQISVRSDDIQPTTLCSWQGNPGDAQPVVVTLMPVQVNPVANAAAVAASPFADILFGVNGYAQKVRVDIGRGCQLVVGANQVTVNVGLEPQSGFAIGMSIAGWLSFKSTYRQSRITRTINLGTILAILPVSNNIPVMAKAFSLQSADVTSTATVDVLDSSGAEAMQIKYAASSYATTPFQPLPNDAATIVVTANGTFQLIFELSL